LTVAVNVGQKSQGFRFIKIVDRDLHKAILLIEFYSPVYSYHTLINRQYGGLKMISIDEGAYRNLAENNQKEELRLLIDSSFWLYLPLQTRKDILNLLGECPHVGFQTQLRFE
jgi:hypothetical protein